VSYFSIDTQGSIARLTLTRADKHNAFDDALIMALTQALDALEADPAVRVVVLAAEGRSFSAGADLSWMKRAASASYEENLADAMRLSELMHRLNTLAKPTVAMVNGAAYGGGVGLIACCDIVLATQAARFSLSEVKLGLIPSAISPYVIAAIGARNARRYFQTAEIFDGLAALSMGLVHEVVEEDVLNARVKAITDQLLTVAPGACREAKKLIHEVADQPVDAGLRGMTAVRIANIRAGDEAREGLSAFLERRAAHWVKG
jgi:methylglutaconyl-CoA hydratase